MNQRGNSLTFENVIDSKDKTTAISNAVLHQEKPNFDGNGYNGRYRYYRKSERKPNFHLKPAYKN